jgi:hypothetical protein
MRDRWTPRPFSEYKMAVDQNERAKSAEQEIRTILKALKANCANDFVVIQDGAIDWDRTIDEFVSFIQLDAKENNHAV